MSSVDIGLVTVTIPERRAAKKLLGVKGPGKKKRGKTYWESKIYSQRLDRDLTIVLTMIGKSGTKAATIETNRMIENYSPKVLFLVGIAAGLKKKVKLFDVVVSEQVLDYEAARLEKNRSIARPDPYIPPFPILEDLAQFDEEESDWRDVFNKLIYSVSTKGALRRKQKVIKPELHKAVVACGEKLIADGKFLSKLRLDRHEKIRAAEMEASGFATACISRSNPLPWLVIRGVSDWGDPKKANAPQYQAACAAMTYFYVFAVNALSEETLAMHTIELDSNYFTNLTKKKKLSSSRIEDLPESIRSAVCDVLITGPKKIIHIAGQLGISIKMTENILATMVGEEIIQQTDGSYILLENT
ncbi:MAG: hypothetical protein JSV88_20000 [Candidatus Aminicenantes bacterium]|nr:MAG: hypothetical protein JSV88_20000 [Candidatus Aminicenantes bacterium]